VKHFCNAKNAILYFQDIEIINNIHDGVSDIETVEEIAMKKPKIVTVLLVVTDDASRPMRPELGSLNHMARGPRRRSRTIGR
jgi:hypothetical protein